MKRSQIGRPPVNASPRRRRRRRAGFTLIEAALTTVIIGTGVLAIVSAQQSFIMKNDWSQRSALGMYLANEVRELMLTMPLHDPIYGSSHYGPETDETTAEQYDDVDDFAGTVSEAGQGDGVTIDPPMTALRQRISDMPGWAQQVAVEAVRPSKITPGAFDVTPLSESGALYRVTVQVMYQGPNDDEATTIAELTWLMFPPGS
ncbi:MAG: hypothetical protein IT442_01740 [Phycisphaeraceae bacterium]|nr:hypothetical protein [Phycisphaeraceae bacterium]